MIAGAGNIFSDPQGLATPGGASPWNRPRRDEALMQTERRGRPARSGPAGETGQSD